MNNERVCCVILRNEINKKHAMIITAHNQFDILEKRYNS